VPGRDRADHPGRVENVVVQRAAVAADLTQAGGSSPSSRWSRRSRPAASNTWAGLVPVQQDSITFFRCRSARLTRVSGHGRHGRTHRRKQMGPSQNSRSRAHDVPRRQDQAMGTGRSGSDGGSTTRGVTTQWNDARREYTSLHRGRQVHAVGPLLERPYRRNRVGRHPRDMGSEGRPGAHANNCGDQYAGRWGGVEQVFLASSAQPLEHLARSARGGSPLGSDDPGMGQARGRAGGDPVTGFACGDRAVVGSADPSVLGTDLTGNMCAR
jgi:hypothetical protein